MALRPHSPACRTYRKRIAVTMTFYMVAIMGVVYYLRDHHPSRVIAYVLAILPAIPILWMLVVVGIYLRDEQDEFQRWMLIRSILWATGIVLAVTTVIGFLQNFAAVTAPPAYYVFVLFWLVVAVVQGVQQIRSGRADD
jgi:small-conductance mechanosensitive channel